MALGVLSAFLSPACSWWQASVFSPWPHSGRACLQSAAPQGWPLHQLPCTRPGQCPCRTAKCKSMSRSNDSRAAQRSITYLREMVPSGVTEARSQRCASSSAVLLSAASTCPPSARRSAGA